MSVSHIKFAKLRRSTLVHFSLLSPVPKDCRVHVEEESASETERAKSEFFLLRPESSIVFTVTSPLGPHLVPAASTFQWSFTFSL